MFAVLVCEAFDESMYTIDVGCFPARCIDLI